MNTTSLVTPLTSHIGGSWIPSSETLAHRENPSEPASVVTTYSVAGSAELNSAISAARESQPSWDEMGILARGKLIAKVGSTLRADAEMLTRIMSEEHGKTWAECAGEVEATAQTFEYHGFASTLPMGSQYPSSNATEQISTLHRPLGVVGVITPWNFPLQIAAWKIAPALVCGNTVVWKPASLTPGVSAGLMKAMIEAGLPAGVVNMILAPGPIGEQLVNNSTVDAVTFTGSAKVGHQIRKIVIGRGARLQMELGGHNATIVMPDVSHNAALQQEVVTQVVNSAMASTGQKCTATRRLIFVGTDHEETLAQILARVRDLTLGPSSAPDTAIGPLVSHSAQQEVSSAVAQAINQGATILAQANVPNSTGYYYPPTVLRASPDMDICREEVFGPILSVLFVETLAEAVSLANNTAYGLTAAVFTTDAAATRYCLKFLEAGLVKVNAPSTGSEIHAPFGGMKDSTFDGPREQNAQAAHNFYTREKTTYVRSVLQVGEK